MTSSKNDKTAANDNQLSKEDAAMIIRELERLHEEFKEIESEAGVYIEREIRDLAGEHFDTMCRSEADTISYLDHADARIRCAALRLANGHWGITKRLDETYEKLATSDTDMNVRESAIIALGTSFARTQDDRIGDLLAKTVSDDGQPLSLRLSAFMSLQRLHGNLMDAKRLMALELNDVDWDLVAEYLR